MVSVCLPSDAPLMPSCTTYRLSRVSLTLGLGYLFTATLAKRSRCSLPWTRGISSPPAAATTGLLSAGDCDHRRASVAEKSYPRSEVRGRSQEDPMPEGRRPRGVTPCPRSGATAESARLRRRRNGREELPRVRGQSRDERSYPTSEVRGGSREELPHAPIPEARGGGGGPTPRLRPGVAASRTNPTSKEQWLRGHRRA